MFLPAVGCDVQRFIWFKNRRVVDQCADRPQSLHGLPDQPFFNANHRKITLYNGGPPPNLPHRLGDVFRFMPRLMAMHCDVPTLGRQFKRQLTANALGCPGDQRGFAFTHASSLGIQNDIMLAKFFHCFPGPRETRRNDEPITLLEAPGFLAARLGQDAFA